MCPVTVDVSVTLLCARAKVVGTTRSYVVQLSYDHLRMISVGTIVRVYGGFNTVIGLPEASLI